MSWTCPYCQHHQVLTDEVTSNTWRRLSVGETRYGGVGAAISAIRCANPDCNDLFLEAELVDYYWSAGAVQRGNTLRSWTLMPQGAAKPQPDYIPQALRADYQEACLIRDLSPKASATLARRCLQGMIRDFCGISKGRLIDEIEELRKRIDEDTAPKGVQEETVDAIDQVRDIGNIGAHMEKDISLIIDVDPGEAQALIELIELLFEEWYIARHTRQLRLKRIQDTAAAKIAARRELKEAKETEPKGAAE